MYVSQVDLIGAIMKNLTRQGVKSCTPRQYNTVIEAASLIVETMARDPQGATPGMTLEQWLASDDVGMSSKYVASVVSGSIESEEAIPLDADDFGRIHRLLTMVDGMDGKIGLMSGMSPEWSRLVSVWPKLTELYEKKQFTECSHLIRECTRLDWPDNPKEIA